MYLFENVNSLKKNQFKRQKTLENMHTQWPPLSYIKKLYEEAQKH